jgi:hypothetical protein
VIRPEIADDRLLFLLLLWRLRRRRLGRGRFGTALLIHLLEQPKRRLLRLVDLLPDGVRGDRSIVAAESSAAISLSSVMCFVTFSFSASSSWSLNSFIAKENIQTLQSNSRERILTLLGVDADRLSLVRLLDQILPGLVSLSVLLRVRDHALDVLIREARGGSDRH